MPQSLANVLVHIIFSTKNREPFIAPEFRRPLEGYVIGVLEKIKCPSLQTGTVSDHMHILSLLSKNLALADVTETVKSSSSKWIKTLSPSLSEFRWQTGYGGFSVSQSNVAAVREYIFESGRTPSKDFVSGRVSRFLEASRH